MNKLRKDITILNILVGLALVVFMTIGVLIGTVIIPKYEEKDFLQEFANAKLEDLMETGYWEHTNSDGCDFQCRTEPYRAEYTWIGEVLYRGVCDIDNAYRAWDESPSHKEILDHEFDDEAIAIGRYDDNRCYIVLVRVVH